LILIETEVFHTRSTSIASTSFYIGKKL